VPRIARAVAVGLPHHLTQRGNDRCRVFFDDDDRRFYLWTLLKYRRQYGVDVWGWCLMENHIHMLAVPDGFDSLARCFGATNLVYTQYINKKRSRSGRLWQNRFFSCVVDRDSYLLPVLRYIERNPVRIGLVKRTWDYEWSSARHNVRGEPDQLISRAEGLRELLGSDYLAYVQRESNEETMQIRRETASGRPLGDAGFVTRLESRLDRTLTRRRPGRPRLRKPHE
jgi:putative transposase